LSRREAGPLRFAESGAAADPADAPVFAEPWQAEAFAMVVQALEKLLAAKGIAGGSEIDALAAAWHRAAHATPHGKPILLENDPERNPRA
jgi:hypothetical protein